MQVAESIFWKKKTDTNLALLLSINLAKWKVLDSLLYRLGTVVHPPLWPVVVRWTDMPIAAQNHMGSFSG